MPGYKKNINADLKQSQPLLFEISVILVLALFLILFNLRIVPETKDQIAIDTNKDIVELAPVIRTDQNERSEKPPAPAKPQIPVEVPNDRVIEDPVVLLDILLDLDMYIDLPSSASDAIQALPGLGGEGLVEAFPPDVERGADIIRGCIHYPGLALNSGKEGRVIVEFVVNVRGEVENPRVIKSMGYGMDEEVLRCVRLGDFSRNGNPVLRTRMQYLHDFILKESY